MIRSCGSVALLGPLLSDEAKETPEWKSWVAHVQLLEFALRQEFSLSDAAELDRLVKAHHEKFLAGRCPPGIVCNTVRNTVRNTHPVTHVLLRAPHPMHNASPMPELISCPSLL